MIEHYEPKDWRTLQDGVCRIFNEIGLNAETDKEITTPRWKVTLDVFAIDPGSVDNIQYIVECKNWNRPIPQSVIHSFVTVIHEVGANIGYIISKHGFQKGAIEYLKNTNIKALTFKDFQKHYMKIWVDRYFCKMIRDVSGSLIQYTEPINSYRERYVQTLSDTQRQKFFELYKKYSLFGMVLAAISVRHLMPELIPRPDITVSNLNKVIEKTLGSEAKIETLFLRDYLNRLIKVIQKITNKFNDVFGKDIFARQAAPPDRCSPRAS